MYLCIYKRKDSYKYANVCKYVCMNIYIFTHRYGGINKMYTAQFGPEKCYGTQLHNLLTEVQNLDRREQIKNCSDPFFLLGLEIVSWAHGYFK